MTDNKRIFQSLTPEDLQYRHRQLLNSELPLDVLRGSLITRKVKCGKPNCHCASGQGHPSLYLSSFFEGRNRIVYVPAKWEPWVKKRLDNYHYLQELIVQLAEINLELLRRRVKD